MGTAENLKEAFAGESQANRRYLFFAARAEKEGHAQIARLFRAAAEAETIHARNHLGVMGGINSTHDNLLAALEGEHHEFTKMYPDFITQAKAEGNDRAESSFDLANKVEQIHYTLYQAAIDALDKGQKLMDEPFFVCQICGNTVGRKAPEKCPICGAPASRFKKVE